MNALPFANLFAVSHPDPLVLNQLAVELERGGDFSEVWRPAVGWIAASAPLPRGELDSENVRAHNLAFAEGRDAISIGASAGLDECFKNIALLAKNSPERLAVLTGDFGFIHFEANGAATVVRSCAGLVPFYLSTAEGVMAVGTSLNYFVRYLKGEPLLDPLINAIWATGWSMFPDQRTFLKNISLIPRGFFARIERGQVTSVRRYWNPRPRELPRLTSEREREHAERLRTILVTRLTRDLDSEGGNLLTLSGGIDSSALGALAAGVVGRKVWTWSYLPEPEEVYQEAMSYISPLASQFGFERSWIVRFNDRTRVELSAAAPKIVFQLPQPALCALPGVHQEASVRVVFGGEFADDICGSLLRIPDLLADTSLIPLLSGLGSSPFGPRLLLTWLKQRSLSMLGRWKPRMPFPNALPALFGAGLLDEYQAWLERRRARLVGDCGPNQYLTLLLEVDGWVDMNWAATSALGIRRSTPFFNREIIELAFACHATELMGPGPKKILRRALRDDVPAWNLNRPDKGNWGRYSGNNPVAWRTLLPGNLQPLIRPDWFPVPPGQIKKCEAEMLSRLIGFVVSLDDWRGRQAVRRDSVQPQ